MIRLILKVEALNKYRSSITVRSVAKEGFAMDSTSKIPSDAKTTLKYQVHDEVHKPHQESTLKRCFKCQGLGHIDFECPNQKVIALIKEDIEEIFESNHVQEDEKSSLLSKSDLEIEDGSNAMPWLLLRMSKVEKESIKK